MQENIEYINHIRRTERIRLELILLFLFWPLLAFVIALRKYHLRESQMVIYLFIIFFGATFYLGNPTFDSFRLYEGFKLIAGRPFRELWTIVSGLFTETRADIVQPLILYTISRLGKSESLLFGTLAAIFGWFYLKGINLIYTGNKIKQNINAGILFFFFIFIIPVFKINGFRFWAAAWVFFYGGYNIVVFHDRRFFFFSLLAVLFHFSYIFPNLVLIAYFLLGNRNKVFSVIFIVSLIVPELFWPQIQAISGFLGAPIQYKFDIYTNPDYVERVGELRQGLRWFMVLSGRGTYYYILFMLFFLRNEYEKYHKNLQLSNLFSFSLLFIAIINFVRYIPSTGRFQTVFYLFAFSYIIGVLSLIKNAKIHLLTWIGMMPLFLGFVITIRGGFEITSFWLLAPLPVALFAAPYSIYEFITGLF